jgi:glutamate synthase (NADPH/NADH) small chain
LAARWEDAMTTGREPDIAAGRLQPEEYLANFRDLHPPLGKHQAFVEADRCYFCHDAPCVTACPTGIDIPMFIREILTDNPKGAAQTILSENILGGMCARVCPTETLCQEACGGAAGKPVRIGELRRYATDVLMAEGIPSPAGRAPAHVAVVGGGSRPLLRHQLAMHGHDVVIFDARKKVGGLSEWHRRLQVGQQLRRGGSRLHPGHRRHQHRDRKSPRPRCHACRVARGV